MNTNVITAARIPEEQRAYVYHVISLIENILKESIKNGTDDRIISELRAAIEHLRKAQLLDLL